MDYSPSLVSMVPVEDCTAANAAPTSSCLLSRRKSFELNKLSYFDFGLLVRTVRRQRRSLRPLDRFFERLHLDKPVAGDQFLRLGEWSIDPRFFSAGRESDSRAFGTGVQTRRIDQNSRF